MIDGVNKQLRNRKRACVLSPLRLVTELPFGWDGWMYWYERTNLVGSDIVRVCREGVRVLALVNVMGVVAR